MLLQSKSLTDPLAVHLYALLTPLRTIRRASVLWLFSKQLYSITELYLRIIITPLKSITTNNNTNSRL